MGRPLTAPSQKEASACNGSLSEGNHGGNRLFPVWEPGPTPRGRFLPPSSVRTDRPVLFLFRTFEADAPFFLHELVVEFQLILEASQVFRFLGGPAVFHHRQSTGISLIEDAIDVGQTFRPQAAFHAAHAFQFLGREAGAGFQGVYVFQGVDGHPARVRLSGGPITRQLGIVQVAFAVGCADDVHLVSGGVGHGFRRMAAPPRGDHHAVRVFTHGLIPEDGCLATVFQHVGAPGEEFHHFLLGSSFLVFVPDAGFLTEVGTFGAFHPVVFRRFVTAQVHVWGGEDVLEFIEDGIVEFPNLRGTGTYQRVGDARVRAHFQLGVREAEEFRIGGAKGLVMTGNIHFRDDFNVPGGSVFHQVLELVLGIHASMGRFIVEGFLPFGGDGFQLGVSGHRETPSLVIRQMEMELVEFIEGHDIDEFFDVLHRNEMPRGIQHHAAPAKPGLVFNDAAGNAVFLVLGPELFQRVFGIEEARAVARQDFHALRFNGDFVSLRSQGFAGRLLEDSGSFADT